MEKYLFNIFGCDCPAESDKITVYPNNSDAPRVIKADEYNFRNSLLLLFGGDGSLHELGAGLLANKDGTFGSPQTSVTVPAGGFLVAFGYSVDEDIIKCYTIATEGAMLYNATRIATFDMYAEFDDKNSKLSICFEQQEHDECAPRYLFVGNSNTYFQGTPMLFRSLCRAAGIEVTVDYCTFGSAYLSEFADPEHERGKALRNALKENKYDYVFLQDANRAAFADSAHSLDIIFELVVKNGATPVLCMPYVDVSGDGMYDKTEERYHDYKLFSTVFGAKLVPAGLSFPVCRDRYPKINLYADDLAHHSKEGAYLMACVWFYSMTGISPIGNPFDPHFKKSVVTALQRCAVIACNKGYNFKARRIRQKTKNDAVKAVKIGAVAVGVAVVAAAVTIIAGRKKK